MENSIVRQRYIRRAAVSRRRRREPMPGGKLRLVILRQVFICVLLLLVVVIFKNINISAANFITDKVKYVLNYNVEIKNIFSSAEKLAADIKKSIIPVTPDKPDPSHNQPASGTSGSGLVQTSGETKTSDDTQTLSNTQTSGGTQTVAEPETTDNSAKDAIPDWENITANLSSNTEYNEAEYSIETGETSEPVGSVLSASTETEINDPTGMLLPVEGTLGTRYGELNKVTSSEKAHTGIDINVKTKSNVISVLDGKVTDSGSSPAYGRYVRIIHSGGLQTVYANCSDVTVEKNAFVKKGDAIAYIEANGTSAGIHLHFEVWKDGIAVDPLEFISVPER